MILSFCATHQRATVPMLECLSFQDEEEIMRNLCELPFVDEALIIQTCNRVEIHVVVSQIPLVDASNQLIRFWSKEVSISRDVISRTVDIFKGRESLKHILFLAAGLESMVIGEDQILGQMRKAYVRAKEQGTVKSFLETVFMKATNVGRKIRTETEINRGSVSISSVAVDLAEKSIGDLRSAKILLVGAGEAGSLAGRELLNRGVEDILVANRTFERGVELANVIGGKAIEFKDLYKNLCRVDLAIVAVSTDVPLLTLKDVKSAAGSTCPDLLILDISQPRCVEEAVGNLPGIRLKCIDDLNCIIKENVDKRLKEAEKARDIVLLELEHLEELLKKMIAKPLVSRLCRKVERIRRRELSKALRMMYNVDGDQQAVIDALTRELMERILQLPIEKMREAALNDDGMLLYAAKKLFNLED